MPARLTRGPSRSRLASFVAAFLAALRIVGGVAITAEPAPAPAPDAVVLPSAAAVVKPGQAATGAGGVATDSGPVADQQAEDDASRRCRGMIPVCRRVPLTVKKPHVEYRMKCELVCVPGCGCLAHGEHHRACGRCAEQGGGCGDVRIRRKKLLLKEVTEKDHESYEYKIFWVCPACAGLGGRCAAATCTDAPTAGRPQSASQHTASRLAERFLEWLPPLR